MSRAEKQEPRARAELKRQGSVVSLSIECPDDYHAMLLYDQMNKTMAEGYLQFWIATQPVETESQS